MKLLFSILPIVLCSCSVFSKECPSITPKPHLNLTSPESVSFLDVKFKVLHKDNAEEYFNSSNENAIFALTESQYKNLAINMQKIKSFVKIQKKQLELYKNYYEGVENGKNSKTEKDSKNQRY